MKRTFETPHFACPWCGHKITQATDMHPNPRQPQLGDVMLCTNCGGTLVFQADMTLRAAAPSDLAHMGIPDLITLACLKSAIVAKIQEKKASMN